MENPKQINIGGMLLEQGVKVTIASEAAVHASLNVENMFVVGGAIFIMLNLGKVMRIMTHDGVTRSRPRIGDRRSRRSGR